MIDFWQRFFDFWLNVPPERIVRLFWYFFLLEVPRYLLFDLVVVVLFSLKRLWNSDTYQAANNQLFAENPLISIIVPGKNEGRHIPKLVQSLTEQTYQNFQLIIVDDGSDDNTPIICRKLEKEGKIDLFLRNEERGGKASAANLALRFAKGKYIVHLDADTSFDRDAIEKILTPFYTDSEVGAVGGNVKVRNSKEAVIAGFQAVEYLQTITMGRMVASYLGIYKIVSGAFGAFRRDLVERVGGWDIGPGLDGDITVKIRKMGYRIVFEPRAVSLTNVPTSIKKLSNQRFRWSRSMVRFRLRKHADIFVPDQNFQFRNFFSSVENLFYNVVLDALWFYYVIRLAINNPDIIFLMIVMKMFLYGMSNFVQVILVSLMSERGRQEIKLLMYIPFMSIYDGYYLRLVRTIAYFREWLASSSYDDAWNPRKSSVQAKEHHL